MSSRTATAKCSTWLGLPLRPRDSIVLRSTRALTRSRHPAGSGWSRLCRVWRRGRRLLRLQDPGLSRAVCQLAPLQCGAGRFRVWAHLTWPTSYTCSPSASGCQPRQQQRIVKAAAVCRLQATWPSDRRPGRQAQATWPSDTHTHGGVGGSALAVYPSPGGCSQGTGRHRNALACRPSHSGIAGFMALNRLPATCRWSQPAQRGAFLSDSGPGLAGLAPPGPWRAPGARDRLAASRCPPACGPRLWAAAPGLPGWRDQRGLPAQQR